jgi:hypothetical protein
MALGSTQPLTGIYKGDRCVGLTTLPPPCPDYLEIWEPQLTGTLRPSPGLYRDCLALALCVFPLPSSHVRVTSRVSSSHPGNEIFFSLTERLVSTINTLNK